VLDTVVVNLLAVIEIGFEPLLQLADLTIRWQTIGVALAALIALGMAARTASAAESAPSAARASGRRARFPSAPRLETAAGASAAQEALLRRDDLALIAVASVPGAVVGGRIVHGLGFWDSYAGELMRLFDPSLGSLSLLGAVLGGTLSGAYMARVLGAPVRGWLDAAAVPLLVALGLGKLAQLLGGSGQGAPFDGPWALAFVGEGPWISASPAMPSHPAQVYEAVWLLLGVVLSLSLAAGTRGGQGPPRGALFAAALASFLLGRILVGFTWRDERLVGPLNVEQALALVALLGVIVWVVLSGVLRARQRRLARSG
jgi:phosphatidylglycerol---prolipoprotein diacylglyceryl transferase